MSFLISNRITFLLMKRLIRIENQPLNIPLHIYFIGLLVGVMVATEVKYQFYSCPVKFFSFRAELVYIEKMRQGVDVLGFFGKHLT